MALEGADITAVALSRLSYGELALPSMAAMVLYKLPVNEEGRG